MIPQVYPYLTSKEARAVSKTVKNNWLTEGPRCAAFSKKLNSLLNTDYGVFAPNGSLGLYLGLLALGIGRGDEVIVPDTTFIASAYAVVLAGATPVFIDVSQHDYQLDISKCNVTRKTKAIMPVHLYGTSAQIDKIIDFAKLHNLLVIEDAAQAIGVKFKNKHLGTFGDVGVFSFFADKTITTGEGAYVICNSEKIYNRLKLLRNQGRINSGSFVHPAFGTNLRITDMQGALGCEQLKKLNLIIKKKNQRLAWYREMLDGVSQIEFFKNNENANFVPFRTVIFCDEKLKLIQHLEKNKIATRSFFFPLHKQEFFKPFNYKSVNFKNSIYGYQHGLCLPIYPQLKRRDVKHICQSIKNFYS